MLSLLACLQSSVWMKRRTKKSFNERWCIVAYLDSVQARVVSLRQLQSATGEELRRWRTLLPSVLDRAFKGQL